jgi:putative membrane protein insertion efficiency factor
MSRRAAPRGRATPRSWAARIAIAPLNFYRHWISPGLPPTCRFYPSCSAYAVEALSVHGLLRGSLLTLWRLLRCGPWHPGGLDPVPPARDRGTDACLPAESERSC